MNDRESRRYDMFHRVVAFGKDSQADFAPDSEAAKMFAKLAGIISELDLAKAGQKPRTVVAREVMLDGLRIDLQNIARTARAIAQDEPGFADKFRLPSSITQTTLLTAADTVITELKKPEVAARFRKFELSPNFVQELEEDRDAIEAALASDNAGRGTSVANTAAIGRLIRDGMTTVNYLDAMMFNKYTRVPAKLRAWKSASHVERTSRRTPVGEESALAPAPRATSTTPAKS